MKANHVLHPNLVCSLDQHGRVPGQEFAQYRKASDPAQFRVVAGHTVYHFQAFLSFNPAQRLANVSGIQGFERFMDTLLADQSVEATWAPIGPEIVKG
jgi:hypothetical protein